MRTKLQGLLQALIDAETDISAHLPVLWGLAESSPTGHVTEFGVRRGVTTVALLAGLEARGGGTLISYDMEPCAGTVEEVRALLSPRVRWEFRQGHTHEIPVIDTTDVLMIDSTHTAECIYGELCRHAGAVRRYLALHDTVSCAERDRGQPGHPLGLLWGLHRWLYEHPEWGLSYSSDEDHGLRVYEYLPGGIDAIEAA